MYNTREGSDIKLNTVELSFVSMDYLTDRLINDQLVQRITTRSL
jgi:hypothetical protein